MDTASYRVMASLKAGGVVLSYRIVALPRLVGLYWINLSGCSKL